MLVEKEKFVRALEQRQKEFGIDLSAEKLNLLGGFYELVQFWNPKLHLVAPCSPEEFAARHVLEALVMLDYLPENAGFADVGTGAGLPSVPCLIARSDLRASLIESNQKKCVYLREAAAKLDLKKQISVFNLRFEEMPPPEKGFVACRALDKFTAKLPQIVAWAADAEKLLFFGGAAVRGELEKLNLDFSEKLIPTSEQRFLFIASPS